MSLLTILLETRSPIISLIGFFIAMIILFYIWNVKGKKKEKDDENEMIKSFFYNSHDLEWIVLRPLSHIKPNWELTWDNTNNLYLIEKDSYAEQLNHLINEITKTNPPKRYHDNEDILAENITKALNWQIIKKGKRWIGEDYKSILEQGEFNDINEQNLILAAVGRIHAAINLGQRHFDDMEEPHKIILASVLAIILYHRT